MTSINKIADSEVQTPSPPQSKSCIPSERIEEHPAWHRQINMNTISDLLVCKPPFSYIWTALAEDNTYLLSYARQDQVIIHTIFRRDKANDGWEYPNGDIKKCKTLDELVSKMMHCEPGMSQSLSSPAKDSALKV